MGYWQGKVALVTGASSGLGLEIARAFSAAGAQVVLAARGAGPLESAAEQLRAAGGQALAIAADITRDDDVARLFEQTLERCGRLDVLVNNAGRSGRRAVLDTTPDDFQQLLDLNLLAVVRTTRAAAPHLLASAGHLVNIGSLAGKTATRYMGAYPASKFALTAYTQQLRLELGPQGLHVLLVCPGPIARDLARPAAAEPVAGVPASALKPGAGVKTRAVRPEKIAAAILQACEQRRGELIFPPTARILFALMQLSPRLADWLVRITT
ncbi:MAG TPA: SDR family oxidoreductase [Pirellulales bacterium]|jgi:NAD(P)-dependent dehydrogenase (short-subunit alcohol dehydrogenase family)|nr:SDR family oxidoreductase [Pirellulales bacterium]